MKVRYVNVPPGKLPPAADGFRMLMEVIVGQKVFVKKPVKRKK